VCLERIGKGIYKGGQNGYGDDEAKERGCGACERNRRKNRESIVFLSLRSDSHNQIHSLAYKSSTHSYHRTKYNSS
jgi:hypothetical protein